MYGLSNGVNEVRRCSNSLQGQAVQTRLLFTISVTAGASFWDHFPHVIELELSQVILEYFLHSLSFIVLHCMSVTLLAFLHWQHHYILKLIEINGSSMVVGKRTSAELGAISKTCCDLDSG